MNDLISKLRSILFILESDLYSSDFTLSVCTLLSTVATFSPGLRWDISKNEPESVHCYFYDVSFRYILIS